MSLVSPEQHHISEAEQLLGRPGMSDRYNGFKARIVEAFVLLGKQRDDAMREIWSGITPNGDCVEVAHYTHSGGWGGGDTYVAYTFSLADLANETDDQEAALPSPRVGRRGTIHDAPVGYFKLELSEPGASSLAVTSEDTLILPVLNIGTIVYNGHPAVGVEDASAGVFSVEPS